MDNGTLHDFSMILLSYIVIPQPKVTYNAVHYLHTTSGFGWDEGTKMVAVTDAACLYQGMTFSLPSL